MGPRPSLREFRLLRSDSLWLQGASSRNPGSAFLPFSNLFTARHLDDQDKAFMTEDLIVKNLIAWRKSSLHRNPRTDTWCNLQSSCSSTPFPQAAFCPLGASRCPLQSLPRNQRPLHPRPCSPPLRRHLALHWQHRLLLKL